MWPVLLAIPLVFVMITLFGYGMHWCLHQPFMGRFYRSHQVHHFKLYPPERFLSDHYLDPGPDNTFKIFVVFGSPLIILPVVLFFLHSIGLPVFGATLLSLAVFGFLNDYLHDAFHIRHSWLRKYGWFERLTDLHLQHHIRVQSNFGIYWFGWDRLWGTFQKR